MEIFKTLKKWVQIVTIPYLILFVYNFGFLAAILLPNPNGVESAYLLFLFFIFSIVFHLSIIIYVAYKASKDFKTKPLETGVLCALLYLLSGCGLFSPEFLISLVSYLGVNKIIVQYNLEHTTDIFELADISFANFLFIAWSILVKYIKFTWFYTGICFLIGTAINLLYVKLKGKKT